MMEEVWKPIEGYESHYEVSNMGRVRSLTPLCGVQGPRLMKPYINKRGYFAVHLYDGKGHKEGFVVHRLVAETFLLKPNDAVIVNHKDENKLNNCADNLEWCSYAYNMQYSNVHKIGADAVSHRVGKYSADGVLVAEYISVSEASRVEGIYRHTITRRCIKQGRKDDNGYTWKYID